ncbi:MAG: glycosyltransferase family 4 protein, partial [Rhodothermales bacterium]
MRLLFVSHSFPPPGRPLSNVGGMQRVATELHAALRKRPEANLKSLLLRTSWHWTSVNTIPFLFASLWRIYRLVKRQEIDVVLFSSMVTASLAVPLQRVLARHGVATAAIVHGLDVTTPFAPYQRFVPHVFKALDLVLPVSEATGQACLERRLTSEKLRVVPNGIDLDRFAALEERSAMRRTLAETFSPPLPERALLLCSVGRQVKRKGFAWFIDQVMPRLPADVHYWLVGDGPEEVHIRAAIAQHGLGDRVRLLGRVSDEALQTLYRGADLFVMPNIPVAG